MRAFVLPLVALLLGTPLAAQIRVGANIHVSAERAADFHGEVLLAASPDDAAKLVGCSMVQPRDASVFRTIVYSSMDGGRSWRATLDSDRFSSSFDPSCAMGRGGHAYFVDLSTDERGATQMPLYRSIDGGRTWSEPVLAPARGLSLDREYVTVDATAGPFAGRVYLHAVGMTRDLAGERRATSMLLFRSTDGGRTLLGPVSRSSFDNRYILGVGNAAVLADGTLVLVFGELKDYWTGPAAGVVRPNRPGESNALLKALVTRDGGESFGGAETVADFYMSRPTWSTSAMPSIAADPGSAAFRDRAYVVWPDERSGRSEVLITHSDDAGRTWATPRRVNDDAPNAGGPDHLLPAIAVNRAGVIGVMWYDRRDSGDNLGWTVRFAASLDGGDTFLPSVSISQPHRYTADGALMSLAGPAGPRERGARANIRLSPFHFNAGHTSGLVAAADGRFHGFWVDNRTGVPQVWTAPLTVEGEAVRNGDRRLASLEDVSAKIVLRLDGLRFDRATGVATATAALENVSRDTIGAMLHARIVELRSEIAGVVHISGADSGGDGEGAVLRFESGASGLPPGGRTASRRLRLMLADLRPEVEGEEFRFGIVELRVRILAEPFHRSR